MVLLRKENLRLNRGAYSKALFWPIFNENICECEKNIFVNPDFHNFDLLTVSASPVSGCCPYLGREEWSAQL